MLANRRLKMRWDFIIGPRAELTANSEQDMLGRTAEIRSEAPAWWFDPSQHGLVLKPPTFHQLACPRHEVIGGPKVQMAVILGPLSDIESEQLLMRHGGIKRPSAPSQAQTFIIPWWIDHERTK